jgi:adenine-specific DNA-methyltransferase
MEMSQLGDGIEEQRLSLQAELDAGKSQKARNRLGQFATPTALARDIVTYGLELLPPAVPVRFLDPAIGTGSFYSALLAAGAAPRTDAAEGYEVDPHYEAPSRVLWAGKPLGLHLADFTKTGPPAEEQRFNLLICNPPYVRHHHLTNNEKVRLQSIARDAFGVHLAGLAGLYCYFLASSHSWMSAGGVAGWLIPSEFMDVNYGQAVKRYLLDKVTLLRIHRFDPNDVQFADALVSSAIVFFRNEPLPAEHSVEFSFGGSLHAPKLSKRIPADVLRHEPKWTRFPVNEKREAHKGATLRDFFHIKRGLVTGDNRFFILTSAQIEAHGLPWQFFRPILPSPRYLEGEEIMADHAGNPLIEPELFLLDCRLAEAEVEASYPALWRYLESGKPDVSERYLCKNRKPWYSQESRPPAPIICTYIGRSDSKSRKPFRFLLNHSKATAANVYLLLYPKPPLAGALAEDPSLTRKVWECLRAIEPRELLGEGRVYGGGLHKLEPSELGNVKAASIEALLPAEQRLKLRQEMQFSLFEVA